MKTLTSSRKSSEHPGTGVLDVVVVGGAGHVGLPLSLALAHAGLSVGILDVAEATLGRIARGEMPFIEPGTQELLAEALANERLVLSSSTDMLQRADAVIVVIGTPIDEFLNPSMTSIDRTIVNLAANLKDGALVVLRSTVFPGTTEHVARLLAGAGRDVDVAFCPERIAEGHAVEELSSLPQIVGADDERSAARAEALFSRLAAKTIRTTTKEAELAKLFTNSWRYIKFAVANQFYAIARDAGVDYARVLGAIKTDYPRAKDLPTPGFAAGPCLLKDTMQLAAFTPDHFPLGHSAMQVNEGMPAWVVSTMEARYGSLDGRSIALLGMAFKADSDDTRSSLAYKLKKLLTWAGATVLCSDPYVEDSRLVPLADALEQGEIVVIGAPHREYRSLDLSGREVVDIWGLDGTFRL